MSTDLLDALVAHLSPERIEAHLFRGQSQDLGWGVVFGGQVLGQALFAALQTVPRDRQAHSLHAYFLRPGDVKAPIVYDVDRIRDGASFTTRRVVAIQHGEPIFNLAASFQKAEAGFEHQDAMPAAPPPESVPTDQARLAPHVDKLPAFIRTVALAPRPFEIRIVGEGDPMAQEHLEPERQVWFKTTHRLPDDPALHQAMLAYASDYSFLTTALKPHAVSWLTPGMQVASIDHSIWFHAPFRADEWLLHVIHSPRAVGSRGLVLGRVFTQAGVLVATTAQEGLVRRRTAQAPA